MTWLSPHQHPPYHLRPNKAVDRFTFVELLRTLDRIKSLRDYVYIGFGGPFLEDFRLLAQVFPNLELISIESDREIHKRQKFHRCSSNMQVLHRKFEDYLAAEFPSDRKVIVWADYTDMARERLVETADIARRLEPWSVFRITVRAETPVRNKLNLGKFIPPSVPRKKKKAFRELQKSYRDDWTVDEISFDHQWFSWASFSDEGFPVLLMRMIKAVIAGACLPPKEFVPLHTVKYSDGTIMLSLTGIFCLDEEKEQILNHFMEYGKLWRDEDSSVDEIDVPILTTKERLTLDKILPVADCTGTTCAQELGYLIDGDATEAASARKLQHYEKYYHLYPYFGKLVP